MVSGRTHCGRTLACGPCCPQARRSMPNPSDIVAAVLAYALANQIEAVGALAGLISVVLLIRQNIWNWPFGVLYAGLSVYLFIKVPLLGQVVLNGYFLLMNLYGWWLWLRNPQTTEDALVVTRASFATLALTLGLASLGVVVLGLLFDQFTESMYPPVDIGIALLSTAAMWLQARKKLESWLFWFVINLASVGLFIAVGNYFYALLYTLYVPMAVQGFVAWRRSMSGQ